MAIISSFEYKTVLIYIAIEHFLFNVFEFAFGQIVEDKMIFQTVNYEVRVVQGFLFRN